MVFSIGTGRLGKSWQWATPGACWIRGGDGGSEGRRDAFRAAPTSATWLAAEGASPASSCARSPDRGSEVFSKSRYPLRRPGVAVPGEGRNPSNTPKPAGHSLQRARKSQVPDASQNAQNCRGIRGAPRHDGGQCLNFGGHHDSACDLDIHQHWRSQVANMRLPVDPCRR